MNFFDFHHHKKNYKNGIYNLDMNSFPPDTFFSVGVHPKDINEKQIENQINWLTSNITENCFAIGECGLDSLVPIPQEIQEKIFSEQIKIANTFKKPVIIHCVRKFYEIISFKKYAQQAMIIHGFNKKQTIAEDLLKHNFYLSIGKAALYNLSLQRTLKNIPIEKIFLETDNEDFSITELYEKVAAIKKISVENLNKQILENLETIKNG